MKRVYFVRHAKSSWSDMELTDFDRPLNKRGKRDAPFMGGKMKERSVLPEIIIASSAKRAKKTAKIIADAIGYKSKDIIFNQSIYDDGAGGILDIITKLDDSVESVMIVGHNPDLTVLAGELSGTFVDNVPTCGIFCLEFSFSSWQKISSVGGRKLFFDYPKKYV